MRDLPVKVPHMVTDLQWKTVAAVVKTLPLSRFEGVFVAVLDCF